MGDSWGPAWSLLRHTMACVGVSCSGLAVEASVTPHKAVERKGGREGGRERRSVINTSYRKTFNRMRSFSDSHCLLASVDIVVIGEK